MLHVALVHLLLLLVAIAPPTTFLVAADDTASSPLRVPIRLCYISYAGDPLDSLAAYSAASAVEYLAPQFPRLNVSLVATTGVPGEPSSVLALARGLQTEEARLCDAFVGMSSSSTAVAVAPLVAAPWVSHGVVSTLIAADTRISNWFNRVVPSDIDEGTALAAVLESFRWKEAVAVCVNSPEGLNRLTALSARLLSGGGRLSAQHCFTSDASVANTDSAVDAIRRSSSRIVVVTGDPFTSPALMAFFDRFMELNLQRTKALVLSHEACRADWTRLKRLHGTICAVPYTNADVAAGFHESWTARRARTPMPQEAYDAGDHFQLDLSTLDASGYLMHDAVLTQLLAIETVANETGKGPHGQLEATLQALRQRAVVDGATGAISFDRADGNRIDPDLTFVNVQPAEGSAVNTDGDVPAHVAFVPFRRWSAEHGFTDIDSGGNESVGGAAQNLFWFAEAEPRTHAPDASSRYDDNDELIAVSAGVMITLLGLVIFFVVVLLGVYRLGCNDSAVLTRVIHSGVAARFLLLLFDVAEIVLGVIVAVYLFDDPDRLAAIRYASVVLAAIGALGGLFNIGVIVAFLRAYFAVDGEVPPAELVDWKQRLAKGSILSLVLMDLPLAAVVFVAMATHDEAPRYLLLIALAIKGMLIGTKGDDLSILPVIFQPSAEALQQEVRDFFENRTFDKLDCDLDTMATSTFQPPSDVDDEEEEEEDGDDEEHPENADGAATATAEGEVEADREGSNTASGAGGSRMPTSSWSATDTRSFMGSTSKPPVHQPGPLSTSLSATVGPAQRPGFVARSQRLDRSRRRTLGGGGPDDKFSRLLHMAVAKVAVRSLSIATAAGSVSASPAPAAASTTVVASSFAQSTALSVKLPLTMDSTAAERLAVAAFIERRAAPRAVLLQQTAKHIVVQMFNAQVTAYEFFSVIWRFMGEMYENQKEAELVVEFLRNRASRRATAVGPGGGDDDDEEAFDAFANDDDEDDDGIFGAIPAPQTDTARSNSSGHDRTPGSSGHVASLTTSGAQVATTTPGGNPLDPTCVTQSASSSRHNASLSRSCAEDTRLPSNSRQDYTSLSRSGAADDTRLATDASSSRSRSGPRAMSESALIQITSPESKALQRGGPGGVGRKQSKRPSQSGALNAPAAAGGGMPGSVNVSPAARSLNPVDHLCEDDVFRRDSVMPAGAKKVRIVDGQAVFGSVAAAQPAAAGAGSTKPHASPGAALLNPSSLAPPEGPPPRSHSPIPLPAHGGSGDRSQSQAINLAVRKTVAGTGDAASPDNARSYTLSGMFMRVGSTFEVPKEVPLPDGSSRGSGSSPSAAGSAAVAGTSPRPVGQRLPPGMPRPPQTITCANGSTRGVAAAAGGGAGEDGGGNWGSPPLQSAPPSSAGWDPRAFSLGLGADDTTGGAARAMSSARHGAFFGKAAFGHEMQPPSDASSTPSSPSAERLRRRGYVDGGAQSASPPLDKPDVVCANDLADEFEMPAAAADDALDALATMPDEQGSMDALADDDDEAVPDAPEQAATAVAMVMPE